MDIGGGSTEFIAGDGGVRSVSLPIGVVVLCGTFPLSDPPTGWQIRNLRLYLAERIAAGTRRFATGGVRRLIGTAGTFTTLAALDQRMRTYRPERIDGYRMAYRDLRRWEDRLARLTDRQRLALPGMERGRERYIVPGVCQAAAAMERFDARELIISDAGLLEGILRGIVDEKEHAE
jgi:exopolyphosphatase/guanosine-5'-triphosphate,3'-diphosphate pyrophosphatase